MAGMTNINLDNDNDIPKIPRLHKVAALMKVNKKTIKIVTSTSYKVNPFNSLQNLNNWATQPRELSDQSRFQKWKQKFRSGQVIDPSQKGQYQVNYCILINLV